MKVLSKFALPVTLLAGLYLLIKGDLLNINIFFVVQVLSIIMMMWVAEVFNLDNLTSMQNQKMDQ